MISVVEELEDILYNEISKKGVLNIDDLFEIFDRNFNYGLRVINGGAIRMFRERPDIEQTNDEKGYMMFRKHNCKEG